MSPRAFPKIYIAALVALLVLALAIRYANPEGAPSSRTNVSFGKSTYYMKSDVPRVQNATIREEVTRTLLTDFYDGRLFYDFHEDGNFSRVLRTVFGPPYEFDDRGDGAISGFNAFVGNALLGVYLRTGNRSYVETAESLAEALHGGFWYVDARSYRISKNGSDTGAVNDAIVGSFYLELYEVTGKERYRDLAKQAFDAILSTYMLDGKLKCCRVGGKIVDEMYTRDGLVVPSLVYAYRVLGDGRYHAAAKKIADRYLAEHYNPSGYFENWTNSGTDAEIAFGLIELYKAGKDEKYKNVLLSQFKYWSGRTLGEMSVVDETEQFILYLKLYELFGEDRFLDRADYNWRAVEGCYSEKYHAFPHGCGGRTYYSAINAIALLGYP